METLTLQKEEVILIPKSEIELNQNNSRGADEPITIEELSESIRTNGLINPIRVRPVKQKTNKDPKYQVVAGNRRLKALRLINIELVPCFIQDMDDRKVLEVQMSENLQRENLSPLEEADLYANYLALNPKDGRQGLAARSGKNIIYINNRLRLRDLSDKAKGHLRMKEIEVNAALKLAVLTHKQQDDALKSVMRHVDTVSGKKWAFEGMGDLVGTIFRQNFTELEKAPFDLKSEGLNEKAPACVVCPSRMLNNPGLFESDAKTDQCMQPTCFQKKCITFYKNVATELAPKLKVKEVGFALLNHHDGLKWGSELRPTFMPNETKILSKEDEKNTALMEHARPVVLVEKWSAWQMKDDQRVWAYMVKPTEYTKATRTKSKPSAQQQKNRQETMLWKQVEKHVEDRITVATIPRLAEPSVRYVLGSMICESANGGHSRKLKNILHYAGIFGYKVMDIGLGSKAKETVIGETTELPKNFMFNDETLIRRLVDEDVTILIHILIRMFSLNNYDEESGRSGEFTPKYVTNLFGLKMDVIEKNIRKLATEKAVKKPAAKPPVKKPVAKVPVKKVAAKKAVAKKKTAK